MVAKYFLLVKLIIIFSILYFNCTEDSEFFDDNKKYVVKIASKAILDEGIQASDSYVIRGLKDKKYICDLSSNQSIENPSRIITSNETLIQPKNLISKFIGKCIIHSVSYWNYSICIGHNITQYHQNEDGKIVGKNFFNLGYYDRDKNWTREELEASRSTIQGFHPQTYTNGDICGLKNQRKESELQFNCHPNLELEVITQYENLGCSYTFIIATSALCRYPLFIPKSKGQAETITCSPYLSKDAYEKYISKLAIRKFTPSEISTYSVNVPIMVSSAEDLTTKILESAANLPEEFRRMISSSENVQIIAKPESPFEESLANDKDLSVVSKKVIIEQDNNNELVIRWRFSYKSKLDLKKLLRKAKDLSDHVLMKPDLAKVFRDSRNTINFNTYTETDPVEVLEKETTKKNDNLPQNQEL